MDGHIVRLNVGGEIFTTRSETLCTVDDSVLASAYRHWRGAQEGGACTGTASDALFLDRDPRTFRFILNCLRNPELARRTQHPAFSFPAGVDSETYCAEVVYLGLHTAIPVEHCSTTVCDVMDGLAKSLATRCADAMHEHVNETVEAGVLALARPALLSMPEYRKGSADSSSANGLATNLAPEGEFPTEAELGDCCEFRASSWNGTTQSG